MGFGTGQAGNFQSELLCQLSGSSSGTGENFKVLSDATGLLQHFMVLRLKLNKGFLSCHSAVGPQTMVIPFFLLFSHFQKLVYHTATETQVLAAHSVPSSLFYKTQVVFHNAQSFSLPGEASWLSHFSGTPLNFRALLVLCRKDHVSSECRSVQGTLFRAQFQVSVRLNGCSECCFNKFVIPEYPVTGL